MKRCMLIVALFSVNGVSGMQDKVYEFLTGKKTQAEQQRIDDLKAKIKEAKRTLMEKKLSVDEVPRLLKESEIDWLKRNYKTLVEKIEHYKNYVDPEGFI